VCHVLKSFSSAKQLMDRPIKLFNGKIPTVLPIAGLVFHAAVMEDRNFLRSPRRMHVMSGLLANQRSQPWICQPAKRAATIG
jgi:hypothetical protein